MPARFTASPRSARSIRYSQKVYAASPGNLIGFWPMWEDSGGVAVDYSGRGNDGAYTSVGLGQPGIGSGRTCPFFNGSASFNDIHSAALNTDFDGAEGALMLWGKVSGAGVWTDTIQRRIFSIQIDADNRVFIYSPTTDNRILWHYEAGNTTELISKTGVSTTDWFHVAITWSADDDEVISYFGGEQEGAILTGLGTWVGNLVSNQTCIGAFSTTPSQVWDGYIAYGALWAGAGTPADVQAAMPSLAAV